MKYLHYYQTEDKFQEEYYGEKYLEPWVSAIAKEPEQVNYNKTEKEKEKSMPLTFEILSNGNISWKIGAGSTGKAISYSKNGGEWTTITSTTEGTDISVVSGDELRFTGNTWPGVASTDYSNFASTCTFKAKGNPASLYYGEAISGYESLANYCYYGLFYGCTGLTSTPLLPATELEQNCYNSMFYGCTGLETVYTTLPALTLQNGCYTSMFRGCTGLTEAPELPATGLASDCYMGMFYDCSSLVSAPELPATTMAGQCYQNMFFNCTSLTKAPALPAMTLNARCYAGMFRGCTGLTAGPDLPAATLVATCYAGIFQQCSHLSSVKCLAEDVSAYQCLNSWLQGVSATGTITKLAGVSYASGANGIPTGWTVVEV